MKTRFLLIIITIMKINSIMVLLNHRDRDAHLVRLQREQHMGEDALLPYASTVHYPALVRPADSCAPFSQEVFSPFLCAVSCSMIQYRDFDSFFSP